MKNKMTINVTNCRNCPFRISHTNYDSPGYSTVDSCGLYEFISHTYKWIASYDEEEEVSEKLNTTLPNCPLKEQEITVKLKI